MACLAWSCDQKSGEMADCSGAIAKEWLQKNVEFDREWGVPAA
jgi:hypothetical protein